MDGITIIKNRMKIIIDFFKSYALYFISRNKYILKKNVKYVFILFAADYNNLGDLAITIAQEDFIRSCLGKSIEIVKVPVSKTYNAIKAIKSLHKENVIITLIGGGNNGSLYNFIESPRRFVLWILNDYNIISFPQTVFFENDEVSKLYEKAFIKCCNRCRHLSLVAREKKSFELYCHIQDSRVFLTPDMVFSLEYKNNNMEKRKGVAFIMRNDKEKALNNNIQNNIIFATKEKYGEIHLLDTCDINYINHNERQLVNEYLKKLSEVKFAVTDRLHGMIFCYISKTPCIVIDNNNGKIKNLYDTWLNNQNFIRMYNPKNGLDNFFEIVNEIESINQINAEDLYDEFAPLRKLMFEENKYAKD